MADVASRRADVRRRGADVEPREGPAPQLRVRQPHGPRPAARRRPAPAPPRAGRRSVVPRLRQRVVPAFGRLAPPAWHDDPDFDIDYHVRRIALPGPGTERELLDLAATLAADPFDRTRPLWEFHVVEGLEGGRAAMVQKMHHTITDGEGGVRMSAAVHRPRAATPPSRRWRIDVSDERRGPPTVRRCSAPRVRHAHPQRAPPGWARASGRIGERRRAGAPPGAGSAVCPARRSATVPVGGPPARGHRRPPAHRCGPSARCAAASRSCRSRSTTPSARRRRSAAASTTSSWPAPPAAPGAYHRELGADVDELRISMPVSTRTRRVGRRQRVRADPRRSCRPASTIPSPGSTAIHERLTATKQRAGRRAHRGPGRRRQRAAHLGAGADRPPAGRDGRLRHVERAGRPVRPLHRRRPASRRNYPMGPIAGTAFNLTTMSYRGHARHGPAHRRRRGGRAGPAAPMHRGQLRRADRRRR